MFRPLIFIVAFFYFLPAIAQMESDSLRLKLKMMFRSENLQLERYYVSQHNDSLKLTAFKFYLSNIRFILRTKVFLRNPTVFTL